VTRYQYDGEGRRTQVTDPDGVTIRLTYDADGRPLKKIDGNGNVTETVYGTSSDGLEGLVAAVVYPTFTEQFRYDLRDRVTQEIKIVDATTRYVNTRGYSATGMVVSETDPRGHTTLKDYDALHRLVRKTDAIGGVSLYRYDTRDNGIRFTDANGGSTTFVYDLADRMTTEIRPLGDTTSYAYDANGNLRLRVNAKGEQRRYVSDVANRRTQEQQFGVTGGVPDSTPSRTIVFSFDPRNLSLGYDDGTTSAIYSYDAKGQRTQEVVNFGSFTKSIQYTYRANGTRASFTYPDGVRVTYAYDPNNQIKTIATPQGSIDFAAYQWQVPTVVTVPGVTKTITYDALLRPTQIKVQANGSGSPGNPSGPLRMVFDYQYDGQNNPVRRSTLDGDFLYQYDPLDRLTSASPPASLLTTPTNPGGLPAEGYAYDAVDNRVASQHQPGPWSYNTDNQLLQYGQGTQQVALQYDANGQTVRRTQNGVTRTTTYDAAERPIDLRDDLGNVLATYYYDPSGRRLKKVVGGITTFYQYSNEGLVAEFDATGALIGGYGWQPGDRWMGHPQFKREGTQFAFYHNDHLGTPQRMTDAGGALAWSAEYEAFGDARVATAVFSNSLRFPGQYFDAETGTHYNYMRDYVPQTGRYAERDPMGLAAGPNAYAYVGANPLARADPRGLFWFYIHHDMCLEALTKEGCKDVANTSYMCMQADWFPSYKESQSPEMSAGHGMCNGFWSGSVRGWENQVAKVEEYIDQQIKTCTKRGMANAAHAAQDKCAAGHSGCQLYWGDDPKDWGHFWRDSWFTMSEWRCGVGNTRNVIQRWKQECQCKDC
jgi:RHS repeat-associated protein